MGHLQEPSNNLEQTLERMKLSKRSSMIEYHKDLMNWSKNVDKRYAWVILFALWLMMVATLGPYRIYGLIFAKVTSDGIYSREDASAPVAMILTVENLFGPIVSIIVYYISLRQSMLIGGIIAILGIGLTAFSTCIWLDIVLLGVVQGFGCAFIFIPFMEFINSYFVKYRNVALGVALTGGTLSIFVLAPMFKWLLRNYPWRYSYIGCACIQALILIAVPLLRPNPKPRPPPQTKPHPAKEFIERNSLSRISIRALTYQNSMRQQSTIMISRNAASDNNQARVSRQSSVLSLNPFASTAGLERKISRDIMSSMASSNEKDSNYQANIKRNQHLAVLDDPYETISLSEVGQDSEDGFDASVIWLVLKTPAFHLIWMNELIYYWAFSIYCLVLVDYGRDRGCSKEDAESLLPLQSTGEFFGRVFLTVLIDMRLVSNKTAVIIVLSLLSILLAVITQVSGYLSLAFITLGVAALLALLYVMLNGLLIDYLGENKVTLGYGMASCIGGALMSVRPQAVGYFRDNMGTYDPLMLCMSFACAIAAVLWIIEPLLSKLGSTNEQSKVDGPTKTAAPDSNA